MASSNAHKDEFAGYTLEQLKNNLEYIDRTNDPERYQWLHQEIENREIEVELAGLEIEEPSGESFRVWFSKKSLDSRLFLIFMFCMIPLVIFGPILDYHNVTSKLPLYIGWVFILVSICHRFIQGWRWPGMSLSRFVNGTITLLCGIALLAWCVMVTEMQAISSSEVFSSFFEGLLIATENLMNDSRMTAFLAIGAMVTLYMVLAKYNLVVSQKSKFEENCNSKTPAWPSR